MSDTDEVPGSGHRRAVVVSPTADASARGRWRALVLTDPVAKLVRNAAHSGIDDEDYDLRQLALAVIDLTVASMGFAREAALEEVLDALTGLAARMQPGEDRAEQWRTVAQTVVKGLLNDAHEQRRFGYTFADLTDPGAVRWDAYHFRLLSLRDTEYGPVLLASDQAVMLYLDGLDVEVEDAEAALAHVLRRQLDDERFDAAVRTAAQAERTSVGMSAMLSDLLDATSRDVRSHDWLVDVPERLARACKHVRTRIGEDDRFLEHVQAGLYGSDVSADVRTASGQIVDLLGRAKQVHLDLERRLVGAREVFLAAQVRQRLARRRRLRLLSLGEELFTPTLALPAEDALGVVETFADRALGVRVPRLARLDDVLDLLWAPPRQRDEIDPEPEDPGADLDGEDVQRYSDAVLGAVRSVLAAAQAEPVRLSALLDAAALIDPATVDGAMADVIELVLLSALWAYAPDLAGDEDTAGEADVLATGLHATDDGTVLNHLHARGADLLVTAHVPDQPAPEPSRPSADRAHESLSLEGGRR
jgi:hypothetical protein